MRKAILSVLFLSSISLFAQEISIDFEDSNLSNWEESSFGHWHIDTALAITGNGSLHHNFDASESTFDAISYKHKQLRLDSVATEWQFAVQYKYAPSSSNNWAFWLASSQGVQEIHPSGSSNGYIIGVNYTGSDDFIKIWRQDKGSVEAIITSDFNWQENLLLGKQVNFKISRSVNSEWILQIDTTGSAFFTIGTAFDSTYSKSEYIGVYYEYSSTQDRKLWVDDIGVKGLFYDDKEPPKLSSFEILEQNEILLNLNEEVDTTGEMLFILNRNYEPESVEWSSSASLVLRYDIVFEQNNLLEIYGVGDLKGNVNQIESVNFQYFTPEIYDVVISEIFADPNPQIKLPECEYVELYNRSEKPLNLDGWKFISGARTPIVFENYIIKPGSYILLSNKTCASEFPESIQKLSFSSFPSLPNSGETLELRDRYNRIIHKLSYNKQWHTNNEKEEGGWSLEMVNFNYPCLITNNWKSCVFIEGGTPGFQNSVEGELEYYPTSIFKGISEVGENSCKLVFSEPLDSISASLVTNYNLEDSEISIVSALPKSHLFEEVILNFSEALSKENLYTLKIDKGLFDCSGEDIFAEPLTFGVPQKADSVDIIINEILFDTNDVIPEFIELYNKSDKVIELNGFSIAEIDVYTDTINFFKTITNKSYQLFPKAYVVLTQDKGLLQESLSNRASIKIIELDSWLKLSNSGGKIGLLNSMGGVLDMAIFSPDMHFSLLKNKSGVSLERISAYYSGVDIKNWHSASTSANYSTPGEENSQSYISEDNLSQITLSTKEFSPDNDGVDDFLSIQYNFPQSGYLISIKIYNQRGGLVNPLINNELCALTGSFVWDGLDESASRLAMGYYILLIEAWHPDGSVVKEKLAVLLLPEKK